MNFNEFLLERRKKISKSQKDVSEDISYSPQVISKWEKGLSIPNVDIVFLLCYSLEISLDDFFNYEVNAPIYKDIDPKAVVTLDGIKKNRRDKNLTQKQLAELINSNEVQIMRYEKGDSFPNIETFIAIAQALSLKPSELLLNTPITPEIPKMSKKKKLALVIGSAIGAISIATAVTVPIVLLSNKQEMCTVTLDANGGIFSNGKDKLYVGVGIGKTIGDFESPTKEGHNLSNWTMDDAVLDISSYTFTSDATIYANWDIGSYTLTIENDDTRGHVTGAGTYLYGSEVSLSAGPMPNYKFAGWYEGDSLVNEETSYSFSMGGSDKTLTATWADTDYLVEVSSSNPNAGTVNLSVNGRYKYGDEISLIATVTDTNYTFIGWYRDSELLSKEMQWTYSVQAYDVSIKAVFSSKQLEYTDNGDGTVTLSSLGGCKYEKNIVVPSVNSDGKKVTGIADGVFTDSKDTLETIQIEDGVPMNTGNLFEGFKSLKEAIIPNDLEWVPDFLFANCTSLTSVNIPTKAKVICTSAFAGCSSLTGELVISKTVETIEQSGFARTGYSSLKFEGEYISIKKGAFEQCQNLTTLDLPVIEADLEMTENSDIFNCPNIKEVTLAEGQEVIGEGWFSDCYKLEKVNFPSTLKTIRDYAFQGNRSLKQIDFPDGLEHIGLMAFTEMDSLKTVFIPKSVERIEIMAFMDTQDTVFYCEAEEQPDTWDPDWNMDGAPVVWGAKRSDVPSI